MNQDRSVMQASAYPGRYDLRATGKLTPVRDQGSCGDCWAFATYGSLESYLMPGQVWDFSEADLNANHGFDTAPCDGGNAYMSMAYLSRYSGPVGDGDASSGFVRKHIQKVEYIPGIPYTFDEIKQAIMTYGAVTTAIGWYDSAYKSSTYSYYYNGIGLPNHDVVIVGWDDAYSKSNFKTPPPGDGAFIIRNSWGADWGEGGDFYLSYYDAYAGNDCWAFDNAESPDNYSTIYQYDWLGWVSDIGAKPGSSTGWGANIFTAENSDALEAVGFYAVDMDMNYEIEVYTGVTAGMPTSGTLVTSQTGTLSNAGYVTISLDQKVPLAKGELFSIVVQFMTTGYTSPVPVEKPKANYSSKATYNPGESFFSADGRTWQEISTRTYKSNVCVKGFAGPATIVTGQNHSAPELQANGQNGEITVSSGTPVTITASLTAGDDTGKTADWWIAYSAPSGWYSLNADGWTPGINSLMQYPLADVPSVAIFSGTLPVGDYTYCFVVDTMPNGNLDSPFYYDMVQVHIVN